MFFSIASSVAMVGIAGYSFIQSNANPASDAEKIRRVFVNAGLNVTENGKKRTIRLYRRRQIAGGMEYVYQLPLGLSFRKINENKHVIEDGLNVRSTLHLLSLRDLKRLKLNGKLFAQIKRLILRNRKTRKEISLDFDGMLRIRVYDEPLPAKLVWSDDYLGKQWRAPIGMARGEFVYHDFEAGPHLIVAGATGFGKSVFLKTTIAALIAQQPDDVEFTLIDLKEGAAFSRFKNARQVKYYATDPASAQQALANVQSDMVATMQSYTAKGFEDAGEAGVNKRHFIVIDEAADLDKPALEIIKDIARRGRGPGYRLIYATQYPTTETIPSQVKRNIPHRLCFILDSTTASMAALDGPGAEELPEIKGRAIYKRVKQTVLQTPQMTNAVIAERVSPHITMRARGDANESEPREKSATDRKHTLVIE